MTQKRKRIEHKPSTAYGRNSIAAVAVAKTLDAEVPELTMPSAAYLAAPELVGTPDEWRAMRLQAWRQCCDCIRAAGYRVTPAYAMTVEAFAGAVVINRVTSGAKATQELIKFFQIFCLSPSARARQLDAENPAKEAEEKPLAPLGMGSIMAAIRKAH